jgi:serine/threonine-protein phosphatase 6 catalytic subunit
VTQEFLHVNGLQMIARAHQLVNEGYQFWFPNDILVTIWSAPNYCYRCGNLAAFLKISSQGKREYITFSQTPENLQSPELYKNVLPYFL